ncbi:MAG: hypothetical protein QNJ11_19050 [Woeseiaceae bacterium]|nr:hypothetical protein [Woeseiaceae bacterium]
MKKLVLVFCVLLWFPPTGAIPLTGCEDLWYSPYDSCQYPDEPDDPPLTPPTSTPPTLEEADAALSEALDQYLVEAYQLAGSTLSASQILSQVNAQLTQQAQSRQAQHVTGLTLSEEVNRMKFRLVEANHPDFANGIPQSFQDLMETAAQLAAERQLASGGAQ